MSTTLEPSTNAGGAAESRVLLAGVGWDVYETLDQARGDRPVPRLTYLDGDIELMSPSFLHEVLARRLSDFVKILARGLRLNYRDAGSTRWTRKDLEKGKEPDACVYLAHEPHVRGVQEIDLQIHPPPDLAIEVILSNPLLEGLHVYGALGVPEVWTFDGRTLQFLHRQADGTYKAHEHSLGFPMLRTWEALGWILRADAIGDLDWSIELDNWVRNELATRNAPRP